MLKNIIFIISLEGRELTYMSLNIQKKESLAVLFIYGVTFVDFVHILCIHVSLLTSFTNTT